MDCRGRCAPTRRVVMSGCPSVRILRHSLIGLAGLVSLVAVNLLHDARAQQSTARPQPNVNIDPNAPFPMPPELVGVNLLGQSTEDAARKSTGCISCHQGAHDPHFKDTVRLGCIDCHGGCPDTTDKAKAHVAPRYPQFWPTSANPVRSYTLLNHESP